MPKWRAESDVLREQEAWSRDGAPDRDLSEYSAWRETAQAENIELIAFYGNYLVGQFAGMGEALSLDAVRAALDIDAVPREDWPEMAQRLILLHSIVIATQPKRT